MTYILADAIVSMHPVLQLNVTEVNSAKCSLKAMAHSNHPNDWHRNDIPLTLHFYIKKNTASQCKGKSDYMIAVIRL